VVFIADHEASAETVLQEADIGYTMRPALTIRMENQPGAGAATFRTLANAGVNAGLLLPVRVLARHRFKASYIHIRRCGRCPVSGTTAGGRHVLRWPRH
jgi:hypothetical protein